MNNFNDEVLKKAKNKINSMLSEKQKEELMAKIKGMDKVTIMNMLKNINPDKIDDPDLKSFVETFKSNL